MNSRITLALTSPLLLVVLLAPGCAAIHPIHGIPAEQLATDCESRSDKATIDLSLLVQSKPDQYRVGPKDVLSVYVPGVLGRITERDDEIGETPPINQPQNRADIPTVGFPLTVRGDGSLPLPQAAPIHVTGMTLAEVEQAILHAYTVSSHVLNSDRARVLVSIARPREHEVLVVRQEKTSEVASAGPGVVNVGQSRRGTARLVRLPAYQNDVLHALAKEQGVDGLPGLDAQNTIYIIRRRNQGDVWPASADGIGCDPAAPCGSTNPPMPSYPSTGQFVRMPSQRYGGHEMTTPTVAPAPYAASPQYSPAPNLPSSRYPAPLAPPQSSEPTFAPPMPGHGSIVPQSGTKMQQGMRISTPKVMPWPGHASLPSQNSTGSDIVRGQSPRGYSPIMPGHGRPAMTGHGNAYPMETQAVSGGSFGGEMSWQQALADFDPTVDNPHVIKIPVRLSPGERPCFTEQDIILDDGDIVFIESRDTEVFYTAGLLGGGQWELPRDYDLRLLEAISIAQGPQNVQAVGNSNGRAAINGDVTVSGSHVVIMRTLPGGARVPISTTIYKAIKHPDEHNIRIQPGDMIYLQYTCAEGTLAFLERNLLESTLFGFATGFVTGSN